MISYPEAEAFFTWIRENFSISSGNTEKSMKTSSEIT